ncbi:MAG: hypothetical protein IKT65_08265 [Clostridia bacterium]|nr:hypothetical protein [Clostridia bacterium]
MKTKRNSFLKVILAIVLIPVALFVLVIGGLNIAKFAIYSDYYAIKSDLCTNPGLNDGFVCQGIFAHEKSEKIFVSGYMKDHSASRVYVTDMNNNSYYVSLYKDNAEFTGHAGGIAYYGETVYIASEDTVYTVDINKFLNGKNGDKIDIGSGIAVNNAASFIYADSDYIYVGEFHDGENYITDHEYVTPNGTNYAIISRYLPSDLTKPNKIYSVGNKVQGICFTPDGKLVTSTSYGLTDSEYFVYDLNDATDSGNTLDGASVYYLGECIKTFKGPAMVEGLDYYNGKVITLTESASDKYIFGKFFFANKIVSLDI